MTADLPFSAQPAVGHNGHTEVFFRHAAKDAPSKIFVVFYSFVFSSSPAVSIAHLIHTHLLENKHSMPVHIHDLTNTDASGLMCLVLDYFA